MPAAQTAHTHHPADSAGSRCMNCHMPRLNEGMQDLVRTHTIFSPTNREMIHANQPNACNQCHTEEPIDWTLKYLGEWYEAFFDAKTVEASYPEREQPAALGWLRSQHEAVRLVAKIGGYLGRNNDPPPGHQLLWRGYMEFQFMCLGFALLEDE